MSEEPPVIIAREGPVLRATLNRPARRNAMNQTLVDALDELIADLRQDSTVRVLVLAGAGGHFCAGLDLTEVGAAESHEDKLRNQQARNARTGARFTAISELPQVVIAAVQGSAFAGGLGFVTCADIALASADALFCAPEVRRGLVPAQILPWLVRRMGRSEATRLVLQGRVMEAAEAARVGLVHQTLPDAAALEAALMGTIADILEGAPGALAETKALLAALGPVATAEYAAAGAQSFARRAASAEAAEGIASFKERRKPPWATGLPRA